MRRLFVLLIGLMVLAAAARLDAVDSRAPGAPAGSLAAMEEREEEQAETFGDDAVRFRHRQMQGEKGEIAPNALVEAAEDRVRALRATRSFAADGPVAGIERGSWTALGPGNIGGRTRAIAIHPVTPQTMWAGSASGGIWKTTDGGASWLPLDDFLTNLRVATLIVDPRDPDVLYAGTGESFTKHMQEGIVGAGVFKTDDGGASWSQLPTTAGPDWTYVNRLALHPADSRVILAATNTGIWRTADAGATAWARTLSVRATDVDFHPTNGSLAVAGGTGAAWYTTDGGASWLPATGLPGGRVEVAYARSSPAIVYASVSANDGEVYRSTNGGRSYALVNAGTSFFNQGYGSQGAYDNALWVDPTDPNTLLVGGIDVYRSRNGGTTFARIGDWDSEQRFANSIHADHHAIVEHPGFNGTTNKTVLFGNDGGVYRTTDVYAVAQTTGWEERNNGYAVTQFYSGAGNATSGRILGGTQDNGTPAFQGGTETWASIFGGDGGYVAADPTNTSYVYGSLQNLGLFRNVNGGTSKAGSDYIASCAKPLPYRIPDACNSQLGHVNFIAPFVLDPNDPKRILAGGASLWRTNDARAANTAGAGPQWAQIKAPLDPANPGNWSYLVSAIAVAPGNPNLIWVGHNGGYIYRTTNGTAASPTWTRVDLQSMPGRMALRLTIDPRDPNTVYAAFSGFSTTNLWRTRDGGATWALRTGDAPATLPAAPVRSIAIHPTNSNFLYAGTEVGVFASEDAGATWRVPQDGPANVSADELFWVGTRLVAATHGRGMFATDVDAVRPVNDRFSSAQPLSGPIATRAGDTNVGASKQLGEPRHAGNSGGASIWYSWTPTASGVVAIDTRGSSFDTLLAVYTGDAVGALEPVAANDDESNPTTVTSKVTFSATAETTYRIAVDGYLELDTAVKRGSVTVNLAQAVPAAQTLSVTRSGSGGGTVTSAPVGVDCGAECSHEYATGTQVTLTATAAAGSTFAGWSGACSGAAPTCTVTMEGARAVTAAFEPAGPIMRTLTVTRAGSGGGTVTSAPAGIDCGADCVHQYADGTQVTLTASPAGGSSFAGWSGSCTGTAATCTLTMAAARAATATFETVAATHTLTVSRAGSGAGSVTSTPAGIDCGADCAHSYAAETSVTLTATAASGSSFTGWSGACAGAAATCVLTMDAARAVTATFAAVAGPPNDDFAAATDLTGASGSRAATSTGADKEPGEDDHAANMGGASVWFDWTAPASGGVVIDTRQSDFDTLLAVYTGSAVGALTPVAGNDDESYPSVLTSELAFTATKDATYRIAVDGYNDGSGAATGAVRLAWDLASDAAAPSNPTLQSPSHSPGTWTADRTVDVAVAGAEDDEAGVDGFSFSWTTDPTTTPDTTKDAEQSTTALTSPPLADGDGHWFHLRTGDNAGNWSQAVHLGPFRIDASAPVTGPVTSTSHLPGSSSFDGTVDVVWTSAEDAHSGLDGFSFAWDTSPGTVPDTTKDADESATATTSPPLAPGTYYFHLRARDQAGNWGDAEHAGPFVIALMPDTSAPSDPRVSSTSHGPGVWSADGTVDVQWSGATDPGGAVDGFSLHWDTSPGSIPDAVKDLEETATAATSPPLPTGGSHYLHLRTRDDAGNWSAAVHVGPFLIDVSTPGTPEVRSTSHVPGRRSSARTVALVWTGAGDAGSGVDGFSFHWDQSPASSADTVTEGSGSATGTQSPLLGNGSHYFHLRARDGVGHWTETTHVGPFVIRPAARRCTVPPVVGKTLRSAGRALRRTGCRVGRVTRSRSRRARPGRVLRQRPAAGARRPAATKVALVLARR